MTERNPTAEQRIHVVPHLRGKRIGPYGFGTQEVSVEQMQALQTVAVSTFAEMVSCGHTFQDALAAVYYSGIVHALEAS